MIAKKYSKMKLRGAVFGCFLAIMGLLGMTAPVFTGDSAAAIARETEVVEVEEAPVLLAVNEESVDGGEETSDASGTGSGSVSSTTSRDGCKQSLGEVGWFTCSKTKKISEAVDWLYGWLEKILVLNPVVMEDGSPVYEIWKYSLMVTNIVFIIFLLVVIYSQLTGFGISNYGIKKALPKLIVTAVLVNLSFLICSLAVDLSNAIGNGLTGLFNSVGQAAAEDSTAGVSLGQAYGAIAGGGAVAIGAGVVAFEAGAIWMLIPVALGAIAAVAVGLFVLALRHAVVVLLIMVAPLAMVANILPNTEHLFKKWKQLFIKMMTFYPLFSLLFGASALAGYAIMMSAQTWFGVLLGIAVQIFPLFFSVSLMKMSGTFLSGIYSKVQGLASRPVASSRAWADSHRQLTRAKHLASGKAYMPSMKLMNYMSDRKVAREEELSEHAATVKNRGLAYNVARKYRNGVPNKEAEEDYAMQAKNMEYAQIIERHKNNMNKGLGQLDAVSARATDAQKARLGKLDVANVKAADALFIEKTRGEKIEYGNAAGRHKRFEDAINAHFDEENRYKRDKNGEYVLDENGDKVVNTEYRRHKMDDRAAATARYGAIKDIMEGEVADMQYAAANAAQAYDTQKKIIETKYQKYFELTPPTRDVEFRLGELTRMKNASEYIDTILPGLRILNQRGDTDLLRKQLENVLNNGDGVRLGTHASQALASFLMFEVKDNDPFLRRFGKYINLETAQVYNKNKRQNERLSLNEYITGEYDDWEPGQPTVRRQGKAKRAAAVLLEGTSLDNVERTAYANLDDMLKNAYTDKDGKLDDKKYFEKRNEIEGAIGPAFISASLKYLSGSEQLKNAVSFLTGYGLDGEPRWGENGDLKDSKMAEGYFREKTLKYIKDQTPTQILGMRSDYRDAMMEHLAAEYFEKHPDEKREFDAAVADIQTRYGDENIETAQKKRKADINKLKMEKAGAQMREILGNTGKLEQIYRTRRSGAANNAKDWLRGMVNLDNESALQKEVDYYREKQRREWEEEMRKRKEADPNFEYEAVQRIYNETDQEHFTSTMSDINDKYSDYDTQTYYEKTKAQFEEWFHDDYIVWAYEKYYKNNPNVNNDDLYTWIKNVLEDLDQYPGNRDKKK